MSRIKLCGIALIGCLFSFTSFAFEREIAITIDDLPFVGSANNNPAKLQREHDRFMSILQALVDNNVPATGFVIAGSIEKGQWELLEAFQKAGLTLGNHTFSHLNLNTSNTDKYIENVARADKILSSIMPTEKYFRYPYLAEGKGEKKQKVMNYLSENHYTIAPVTIDSKDFRFNERLYKIPYSLRAQNLNQMKKQYLAYIWDQTLRAEKRAGKDKPAKQILLIHSNLINSYFLGDIIKMYQEKGYRFITLNEALEQPAPAIEISSDTPASQFKWFDDGLMNTLMTESLVNSKVSCCLKS